MNAFVILAMSLSLSGCNIAARLANGGLVEPDGTVVEPSGEVITPAGEVIPPADYHAAEIVSAENDMCLVRARHFHGLVRVPCDQIAREPAP
jgi:hypothetical protein